MKITMIGRNKKPSDYRVYEGQLLEESIFEVRNQSVVRESSFSDYQDVRLEEIEGDN